MKSIQPLRQRRALMTCIASAFLMAGIAPAYAADAWPSKPITLIVPFAPGGTTDIVGRIIGQKLGEALHQAVIVENRAGAGGTVGAAMAARAAADGYTFLLATVAHTMAPGIYKTLPYDFSKELDPVGLVALTRTLLPNLIGTKGAIIDLSSVAATYPYRGGCNYAGTKAYVHQFTLGLRCDLQGTGVRVTSIEPGMVETEFTVVRNGGDQAASDAFYGGVDPMTAQDIANTIHWVATLPPHLNINVLELMPVNQSWGGFAIHRPE